MAKDLTTIAEIVLMDDGNEVKRIPVALGSRFENNWLNIGEWPDVLLTRNDLSNPQLKVSLASNFISWVYSHDDNSTGKPVAFYTLKTFAYLNL